MHGGPRPEAGDGVGDAAVLTKYTWTVYVGGQLFDIMTDDEVDGVLSTWIVTKIDKDRGVIEFE